MQKTYAVELTGVTPLLMHADDLRWRATLDRWLLDPENKKNSRAGDDRTPAWRWIGNLYHDAKCVGVACDNIMTLIREGGARVPTGKGQTTYKRQSQSGIVVTEVLWPICSSKGLIPWGPIKDLMAIPDYDAHEAAAEDLGFMLFAKSAKVQQSKHVRVRPRFDEWSIQGTVTVLDETITTSVLENIFSNAGRFCGLGDWRPSSPKSPGPFGKFTAELKEV